MSDTLACFWYGETLAHILVRMAGVPPARRRIRLFPDYGRDWPLWKNPTPSWDPGYTLTPEMDGLSEALTKDLSVWNTLWVLNFDELDGWSSTAVRDRWRSEGEDIAARLRAEVAESADVEHDPWPLHDV